mmetsp:Transcript_68453/g.163127  ORF Transcript_68453/g.163127 Transcript_68453/m.163127 type:complete len:266 (+) Transcript_68453:146-943(+)
MPRSSALSKSRKPISSSASKHCMWPFEQDQTSSSCSPALCAAKWVGVRPISELKEVLTSARSVVQQCDGYPAASKSRGPFIPTFFGNPGSWRKPTAHQLGGWDTGRFSMPDTLSCSRPFMGWFSLPSLYGNNCGCNSLACVSRILSSAALPQAQATCSDVQPLASATQGSLSGWSCKSLMRAPFSLPWLATCSGLRQSAPWPSFTCWHCISAAMVGFSLPLFLPLARARRVVSSLARSKAVTCTGDLASPNAAFASSSAPWVKRA